MCWCTENSSNQKINNLKSYLLNYYQSELREWKNINYLDDIDKNEVIKWLECIIRKIKQYIYKRAKIKSSSDHLYGGG